MSNMSEAAAEAYASGDSHLVEILAVTFNHAAFPEAVNVVAGVDEDLMLPLVDGGTPVLHKKVAFEAVPPGIDKDGPTDGSINVDGANTELIEPLRLAAGQNSPISITLRRFLVERHPNYVTPTVIDEEYSGMVLKGVKMDESGASGTLTYPDERELNFPLATYEPDEYPGLVGVWWMTSPTSTVSSAANGMQTACSAGNWCGRCAMTCSAMIFLQCRRALPTAARVSLPWLLLTTLSAQTGTSCKSPRMVPSS